MKRLTLFLLGLFLGIGLRAQTETMARLKSARIYRNMAMLTHRAEAQLPAGTQTLVIHGLSPYMVRESFRLQGIGDADIVHMDFRKNFLIQPKDQAELKALDKQIQDLKARIADVKAREKALETERDFIKQNLKLDKNASLATLQQISAYYKKRIEANLKESFRLKTVLEPLGKKLKRLQKQRNELQSRTNRETYDAVITLAVNRPGKMIFTVRYLTRRASWAPVYTVRSPGAGKDLHWETKAEIRQNTGLDWENIRVSLSTYQPNPYLRLPQVQPWYLSPIVVRQAAYKSKRMEAVAVVADSATEVNAEMNNAPVERQNSTLQVEFKPTHTYTVRSGGKPTLVGLESFDIPAEYTYFTAPYQDNRVYLRARIKDLSRHRLVPGKARIYFEDVFTGEVYVNPQQNRSYLDLPLGDDPEIRVKRTEDQRYAEYNLLGNKVKIRKAYIISIRNNKNMPVHIIVKDRFPVSRDEQIKVRNTETDGHPDNKGIITWDKTLPAGGEIQLHLRFEVQYPKSLRVYGI